MQLPSIALLLALPSALSFLPLTPSFLPPLSTKHTLATTTTLASSNAPNEGTSCSPVGSLIQEKVTPTQQSITPIGYGFTTPASRILSKFPADNNGFVTSYTDELVTDVVGRMFLNDVGVLYGSSANSVALVFDRPTGAFTGIFTERDYVVWSGERDQITSDTTPDGDSPLPTILSYSSDSATSTVADHCTPASKVVFVTSDTTASGIVNKMKEKNIRHVLVSNTSQAPTSLQQISGVVSMSKVMNVVVVDERLSIDALTAKFPESMVAPALTPNMVRDQRREAANELSKRPGIGKQDLIRTITAITLFAGGGLFLTKSEWLHQHADLGMIVIFTLGYLGIIFEELFEFNKAGIALLMSTALWITYADFAPPEDVYGVASEPVLQQLKGQLADVSNICFFLLAASTIVEVVDAHQGFKVITNAIKPDSKKQLFWIIGFLTFFLSAILNNLTVTIVMISLLRKIIPDEGDRKLFGAMVVVAANAGGVWTPIGDVTTTMLWINHNLSTFPTISLLFLPSIVCLTGSLFFLQNQIEEDEDCDDLLCTPTSVSETLGGSAAPRGNIVLAAGVASLLAVPVFSELTGLPPYLAMLTGLGAMWTLTDLIHFGEEGDYDKAGLKVPAALSKLDTSGILFFLGILMSIGALDQAGLLSKLAVFLNENIPQTEIIATVIGIASALIDNVPLVAATMGMYNLNDYAADDPFWQLIALCAGTGGSILVIGSASGVALMGLEKVDFLWYAKKVSLGAAAGYFAGIGTYLAQGVVLNAIGGGGGLGGILEMAQAGGQAIQSAMIF